MAFRTTSHLFVALLIVGSAAACGSDEPEEPATRTVDGTLFVVPAGDDDIIDAVADMVEDGDHCRGLTAPYTSIDEGSQMTVTNQEGEILNVARLGRGEYRKSPMFGCEFPFTATVPVGERFYSFEIGKFGAVTFSPDELDDVVLSLGS